MNNPITELLVNWPEKALAKKKENRKFFQKLKRTDKKRLDANMHKLHEEVFACTDCLACANCCKTIGPLLTQKDIERLAKREGVKANQYIDDFVRIDEDGDYVFKTMPCRYLNDDNTCQVYDVRPKACREYPHTDRIKQYQILHLTRKNVEVCPAVYMIIEKLKSLNQLADKRIR
jgi:Fe-S-cluster containining protein